MRTTAELVDYPANLPGVIDLGHRHYAIGCGLRYDPIAKREVHTWWIWWHDCTAVTHTSWNWVGDQGDDNRSGHIIESADPLTITGSLICIECRDHGLIERGAWRPL